MWSARQHGNAKAGLHKSEQCFVFFTLEGQLWEESSLLA